MEALAGAAGADEIVLHRPKVEEGAAGFFHGLAAGDVFGPFAGLDDPGSELQLPRRETGGVRADAELLAQHESAAIGVVGQNARRVAALEHFPVHEPGPAAVETAVAERIGVDAEVALVSRALGYEVDL